MKKTIKLFDGKVEILRPIAEEWKETAKDNGVGIVIDDIDKYLVELHQVAYSVNSDLLFQYDGDMSVGFIGLRYFESPIGSQRIANENYYYVLAAHRTESLELFEQAKLWAKLKGCACLIMNASNLASDLQDKVCRLYKSQGLKLFETSFITKLE